MPDARRAVQHPAGDSLRSRFLPAADLVCSARRRVRAKNASPAAPARQACSGIDCKRVALFFLRTTDWLRGEGGVSPVSSVAAAASFASRSSCEARLSGSVAESSRRCTSFARDPVEALGSVVGCESAFGEFTLESFARNGQSGNWLILAVRRGRVNSRNGVDFRNPDAHS